MTHANRDSYDAARDEIRAGRWRVDPLDGLVYGCMGAPFRRCCHGYIQIKFRTQGLIRNRFVLAHRVIWEYVNGPLADHLVVNHLNGVRNDNRIVNLEGVTTERNNLHALMTGLVQTGEQSSNARLTEDQVREIYRRAWAGDHQTSLGAEFGVTSQAVSNIKQGHTWAYVTGHEDRRRRPSRMACAR